MFKNRLSLKVETKTDIPLKRNKSRPKLLAIELISKIWIGLNGKASVVEKAPPP
jgi:hypothetical protein